MSKSFVLLFEFLKGVTMLESYIGNIWNNKKIKAEQSKKWLYFRYRKTRGYRSPKEFILAKCRDGIDCLS
jgi:hypothetical protein